MKNYFVHESSYIDENVLIGKDTRIWHFCHILSNAHIGNGCNIGQNVMIGPDVKIGNRCKLQNNISVYPAVELEDDVFCGPSMVFTNVINPRAFISRKNEFKKTLVRTGASLGANCTIVCGNTIGRFAMIAAGAVVNSDVPDYALMAGVPARQIGWVCRCGSTLKNFDANIQIKCSCGNEYKLADGGLTVIKEG